MDFYLADYQEKCNDKKREVIILSCSSKKYFEKRITLAGAKPLLWTTGLMAPEAYTLENAVQGWVFHETDEKIRLKAAQAYYKYQQCGLGAAKRLFAAGM